MTLTEDFTGTSLPDGWTFNSPSVGGASGSFSVANSRVSISLPAGQSFDSYFANSGAGANDNSAGIQHAYVDHGGSLDIAVQFDTDVSKRKGHGVNLIIKGADPAEYVRVVLHHPNNENQGGAGFGYTRNTAGGASAFNTPNFGSTYSTQTGLPSWVRITLTQATGVWLFLASNNGVDWYQIGTVTRLFVPSVIKVGMTSVIPSTGGTVRVNQVVDLLAGGTTDLRAALPARNRDTITVFDGATMSSLPAGWVNASVATSSVTFVSNVMRFTDTPTASGIPHPTARIRYEGTGAAEWGLLCRMRNTTGEVRCYCTIGAGVNAVDWPDQYVPGYGYGQEVNSGIIRRPIRVDDITDTDIAVPVDPPTGLDERRYYWIADHTNQYNMRDGGWRWFRLERHGRRYRAKEWDDAVAEPDTWNLFDGQDEVYNPVDITSVPFISYTRNTQHLGDTSVMDFSYIEFYSLTALATLGSQAGGHEYHIVQARSRGRSPTDIVDVAHERYRSFQR